MLQDVTEVRLVETLRRRLLRRHVLQQRVQDLQTCNTGPETEALRPTALPADVGVVEGNRSRGSPVSATFLMVCLKAQMMESRISLNWAGAMDRKAAKHWEVAAWRR